MISGYQLKALRISAGLTQSQLAEKLGNGGYTKQEISKTFKSAGWPAGQVTFYPS